MGKRQQSDQYLTHTVVTYPLVDHVLADPPGKGLIIEPSAGLGSWTMTVEKKFPSCKTLSVELDPKFKPSLIDGVKGKVLIKDFMDLKLKPTIPIPLIIGNPPYSICQEFVERSLEMTRPHKGRVVFLLRAAFMETARRLAVTRDAPLKRAIILSWRPSFMRLEEESGEYDMSGSDATMYALFEWDWNWEYAPYIEWNDTHWRQELKRWEAERVKLAMSKHPPKVVRV
jgi:hypothetical protein